MAEFVGTGAIGQMAGEVPRRSSEPTNNDLPSNANGTKRGLMYIDVSVNVVKVTIPDGSGGVATGTVVDLSGSVSL